MRKSSGRKKESAPKRRKNAAHGASRGFSARAQSAPEGRKKRSRASHELRLIPIVLEDEIRPGDALSDKLLESLRNRRQRFQPGDILIVKHKIVSKSEGCLVDLATIHPSDESVVWAKQYNLDARVIELALRESRAVIRRKNGVLITETHHGFLCANSGVDVSNVNGGSHALLLPEDPDRSAANLRRALNKQTSLDIPVIITDSFGRQLACAAGLVCGKLNRAPACIVRGFRYDPGEGSVRDLLRPAATDLFR